MKKRILAMLLAVTLVIGILPVNTFAAGTAEERTKYESLTAHEDAKHICEHCIAAGKTDAEATVTWTPWGEGKTKLPTADGHYYLTKDLDVTTAEITSGHVVLCLNGKTVTASGTSGNANDRFYTLKNGGSVTILDCTAKTEAGVYKAGTMTGGTVSGFMHNNSTSSTGSINIYDGIFTGNSRSSSGAAFCVQGKGKLNIYGGEFTGNSTNNSGGVIYVGSGQATHIEDAVIKGNTAGTNGGVINTNGTLVVKNSELTGNTASKGGAIHSTKVVTLDGAVITGNAATEHGAVTTTANVTVKGETVITGNKLGESGISNLYLQNNAKVVCDGLTGAAKISLTLAADKADAISTALGGADVAGFFAFDDSKYIAKVEGDVLVKADAPKGHENSVHTCEHCDANATWTAWGDDETETKLPTAEGHYYLTRDMEVTAVDLVEGHVVLCLNGKTVTANGTVGNAADRFYNIRKSGSLTIVDCTASGEGDSYKAGKFTGASNTAFWMSNNTNEKATGSITVHDGIFEKNIGKATGAVFIIQGTSAKLNVYGGRFAENEAVNTASSRKGAGVVYGGAAANTIHLENAVFYKNRADYGGVLYHAAGASSSAPIQTTVINCVFDSNESVQTTGGALCFNSNAGVNVEGCTFTGNVAATAGGAIRITGAASNLSIKNSTFTGNEGKGGAAVISAGGRITVDGVTMTGNTSTGSEGAVHFLNAGKALVVKGDTQIHGNTNGNVVLGGSKIEINGLDTNAKISVAGVKGDVLTDALDNADAVKGNFVADNADLTVDVEDGKLVLAEVSDEPVIPPVVPANHTHCVCGDTSCTDTTGIHKQVAFTEWGNADAEKTSLPTSGNYCLTADVILNANVGVSDTSELNLCLNGHKITCKDGATFRHFTVDKSGKLTITDCAATPGSLENGGSGAILSASSAETGAEINLHRISLKNNTRSTGGTIIAQGKAVFNLYDVQISGSVATSSSGVIYMQNSAQVNITGGSIHDNHSAGNGGVFNLTSAYNKLTVKGTEIKNNTTDTKGGVLYTEKACTVSFEDCVITGNHADSSEGGVAYLKTANSTFKNCQITENSANNGSVLVVFGGTCLLEDTKIQNNHANSGYGAVHINRSGDVNVTLQGETIISGNTTGTANKIQNVFMRNSASYLTVGTLTGNAQVGITMENARLNAGLLTISANDVTEAQASFLKSDSDAYAVGVVDNKAALVSGHSHKICTDDACADHSKANFAKWDKADSLPASGNYYLTQDVTLSANVALTGTTLNLCLNGYNIYVKEGVTARHFYLGEGAALSITDCSATPGALQKGTSASIMTNKDAKNMVVNLFNIGLKNNSRAGSGGVIAAQGQAIFNLTNVEISNNEASGNGGVVYAQNTAELNITGGSIHDNQGVELGGVFYLTSGSNKLNVKGTEIYNNTVVEGNDKKGNGAVLYTEKTCTVSFEDCIIRENKAEQGEGIFYLKTANSTFKNCQIKDNAAQNGSAMIVFGGSCLLDGTKITGNHEMGGYGAIHLNRSGNVTLTVQGETVITGNTYGDNNIERNVYMRQSTSPLFVTVGELTGNAKVGITMENARLNANNLTISANEVTEAQAAFLSSDNADYTVKVVDGKARLTTGHDHKVCVDSTCTEHDAISWRAWTKTDSLPSTGNYYLAVDVVLKGQASRKGTLNLCLNGHTITAAENDRVFFLENPGKLSITDCTGSGVITGGSRTYGGAISVRRGATLNLYAGKISGNTALTEEGGAIYIVGGGKDGDTLNPGGVFNMYGGEISGNTARQGAAIRLTAPSGEGTNAQFNMYGGKICGNEAKTNGSAVYATIATVNIFGGEISGNTAGSDGTIYAGDGILLNISGGTITGNVAGNGAGVYVTDEAIFTVSGSTKILGNTSAKKANNVFLNGQAIVTLGELAQDAKIGLGVAIGDRAVSSVNDIDYSANFQCDSVYKKLSYKEKALYIEASVEHNHCVCAAGAKGCDHTSQKWQAWESGSTLPSADGYYYLTEDVVLSTQGYTKKNVHLCLNGHTVSMKEGLTGDARVFKVDIGGTMSVTDCQGTGVMTGGSARWGAGFNVSRNSVLNLYGGTISGNKCLDAGSGQGGAIYLQAAKDGLPGGVLNMYGGTITDNETVWGAAVYGANKATINIYGGTISNNKAEKYGAAVFATGCVTNIENATFEGNYAKSSGGAVYVTGAGSKLTIKDSTFKDNTIGGYAGGAILAQSNDTEILISGCTFTGSKADAGGAIFASTNTKLTVNGSTFTGNTAKQGASIYALRATSKIDGVTITGNTTTNKAAGIYVAAGEMTIENTVIKNNKGGSGTAITTASSSATVDGKKTTLYPTVNFLSGTISGNEGNSGVILLQSKTVFNMKGGTISGNSTTYAGGVYASTGSTFNMYGGSISNNTAKQSGGGIYALRSTVNLYGGTLSGNTAEKMGGGVFLSGAKLLIQNARIVNNKANTGTGGGGVGTSTATASGQKFAPSIKMVGGEISGNDGRHGGAVLLQGTSETVFDLEGGKITNNTSRVEGGAFYISTHTTINMTGGLITGNYTTGRGGVAYHNNSKGNYTGGEIYANESKSSGGAFLVNGATCKILIKDIKLYDFVSGGSGGAICHQGKGYMTLENVEIYNNTSNGSGGGVYVANNTYLDATNVVIRDNTAKTYAGGLYLGNNTYINLDKATIENNTCGSEGGGIYSRSNHMFMTDSKIVNNKATGNGGGICSYAPALQGVGTGLGDFRTGHVISNTEFSDNTTQMQGGGIYVHRGSMFTLQNVTMTENTANLEGSAIWAHGDLCLDGLNATGNNSKTGYAVYLEDSRFDGHSYATGVNKLGGDVIVNGNEGGDLYMGENTTAAMLETGFGEKTNFNVTLHSGLLTNKLYGEYNYEGGDLNYTVTYGSRSLTEPEYAEPVQETEPDSQAQPGTEGTEPAQAGEDNTMLYAGIGGIAGVLVLAAIVLVIVKKKKAGSATGGENK